MLIHAFKKSENPNSFLKDLIVDEKRSLIKIGNFTYGPPPLIRYWGGDYNLTIGKYCSLADNITFFLGGDHSINKITTSPLSIFYGNFQEGSLFSKLKNKNRTLVCNDVWIGSGATIMSGVSIGDGAIIGARAVVANNVPAYAIYAGNPSKLIRYRFSESIIMKLLKLKWWDWDEVKIRSYLTVLDSEPTDALLEKLLSENSN